MDDIQRIQNRISNKQAEIRRLQKSIESDRKDLKRAQDKASGRGGWLSW